MSNVETSKANFTNILWPKVSRVHTPIEVTNYLKSKCFSTELERNKTYYLNLIHIIQFICTYTHCDISKSSSSKSRFFTFELRKFLASFLIKKTLYLIFLGFRFYILFFQVSVTFDPTCYLSLPLPVKRERQIEVSS